MIGRDKAQGHRPCPDCGSREIYIRCEPNTKAVQAHCRQCNYTLDLGLRFPCKPEEIIEAWDKGDAL